MPTIPDSIEPSILIVTAIYLISLFLFVFFRVVVFNFALKKRKRQLSLAYDLSLFFITTFWLLFQQLQDFINIRQLINDPYDSPILLFASVSYFVSIVDFIYNSILYKKMKVSNEPKQLEGNHSFTE